MGGNWKMETHRLGMLLSFLSKHCVRGKDVVCLMGTSGCQRLTSSSNWIAQVMVKTAIYWVSKPFHYCAVVFTQPGHSNPVGQGMWNKYASWGSERQGNVLRSRAGPGQNRSRTGLWASKADPFRPRPFCVPWCSLRESRHTGAHLCWKSHLLS